MAEKRYIVPEGMLKAAQSGIRDATTEYAVPAILEAAIQWLAENPISFTTEQIQSARQKACMGGQLAENYARVFEELQRRMFLAPEPEPLEDLLSNLPEMVRPSEYRSAVIEAFNRGKKFK